MLFIDLRGAVFELETDLIELVSSPSGPLRFANIDFDIPACCGDGGRFVRLAEGGERGAEVKGSDRTAVPFEGDPFFCVGIEWD